jgi:hypothetical protein
MLFSTFLTLVLIPIVYILMARFSPVKRAQSEQVAASEVA